jgi:predicted nucleic acid-binding protein
MTRPVVVDASVAAKWFVVEHDSERAFDLLALEALFAPQLLAVEVAAAITRRFRMGAMEEGDARRKLQLARETLRRPVFQLLPDADLIERASEIALTIRHPVQDCLYIACAERSAADVLTVDPTLLKRAAPMFSFVQLFR